MTIAVKTEGLTKTYRLLMHREPVNAVCDLDLEVHEGEIFGFLGPNGAGKTTTIKILLGLTYPTSGKAWLFGKPAGDISVKREISYLPESPYFYEYMSGVELLDFYARLFGLNGHARKQKVEDLLKAVGLYEDRHKPLSQYSKGMLQRIGIAQALVNDPKLLFFDEPTSGLDPIAHSEIRDLILRLRDEGRTVFLSSHQLSDVEMVCDRVAILNRGRLLKLGRLDELLHGGSVEVKAAGVPAAAVEELRRVAACVEVENGSVTASMDEGEAVIRAIDIIRTAKGRILLVAPKRRTLEELFMEIIREESK
ncbi:MAG TPA: ABC transporter ATP-binding protein [Armatimonadota bacterium]|nr:ABC transporter ATP-binding protein [Armatimonadota bacterium]